MTRPEMFPLASADQSWHLHVAYQHESVMA
jgi:hypothetical protein